VAPPAAEATSLVEKETKVLKIPSTKFHLSKQLCTA